MIIMATTIQIDNKLKDRLDGMKMSDRETYNDVLERVLEDLSELDDETKNEIEIARKQIREGRFKTHEQVKKELGIK